MISKKATAILIKKQLVESTEEDLYMYGFFMLISQLIYSIVVMILGALFGCFLESVIFFIAFVFIRKFAGGYHAKTELHCQVISTLSIFFSIVTIHLSKMYDLKFELLIFSAIASLIIFFSCPIDTEEKPLNKKEYLYFRKISWIILAVITVFIIVSYIFEFNIVFAPCCISVILESILILTGKMKKLKRKKQSSV